MKRNESVIDLIKLLNTVDEQEDIEAKRISGDKVGKSVYETICSLSNEPYLEGGTILLGVDKEESLFTLYTVSGVDDPDRISIEIASACNTMFNQPLRVSISAIEVDNKVVVRIDVAELPANQKPIYFKSRGLPSGAYRRIGPADMKCSDEDIQLFMQGKASDPFDTRLVRDTSWGDIDPSSIAIYRKARRDAHAEAPELDWSDEELLYSLGAIQRLDGRVQVTIAGLLTFGKASSLRRLLPSQRVDYIRVPTKTWVEDPDSRYDTIAIRGPIVSVIGRTIAAINDDLPKTFDVGDSLTGQRTETPVIPTRVIREAVVNALMHRSYETYQPIQIVRYPNRIEIKNPGHSLKSQDRFSEPGSMIRNPTVSEVLHETRFAENKGSGIRVMQKKMALSGLTPPTFESDREAQSFMATFLFHHFLGESDWDWLAQFSSLTLTEEQMKALIFVREIGAIDNSSYRDLTQTETLAASKSLRFLVREELLIGRGSGHKTYYVAGPKFLELTNMDGSSSTIHDKPINMDAEAPSEGLIAALPPKLRVKVRALHLSQRANPDKLEELLVALCKIEPRSLEELATYVRKSPAYLSQKFVTRLVQSGVLAYVIPEMPKHPNQKYKSVG